MPRDRMMIIGGIVMVLALLLVEPAFASSTGGANLPWESPLQQIQQSITGPVAGFFGGELNDFARRLMYVVLVAGILLGATQIVALFGASGASIGDVPPLADGAGDLGHG
jgi:type IV secretion system protein VirB2